MKSEAHRLAFSLASALLQKEPDPFGGASRPTAITRKKTPDSFERREPPYRNNQKENTRITSGVFFLVRPPRLELGRG